MVPKADSGAFLLLFLLVLTVTEPLRPGARGEGRGAGVRGGAGCRGRGGLLRGWGRLGPPSWEVAGRGQPAGCRVPNLEPWPSRTVR